jgi:hypothetical protein
MFLLQGSGLGTRDSSLVDAPIFIGYIVSIQKTAKKHVTDHRVSNDLPFNIYIYIVKYLLHIYKNLLNDTVIAIVADEKRSLPSHLILRRLSRWRVLFLQ